MVFFFFFFEKKKKKKKKKTVRRLREREIKVMWRERRKEGRKED